MELNVPIFSPDGWLPVFGTPEMSSPLGSFGGKRGVAVLTEQYINCGPRLPFKTQSSHCTDSFDLYLNGEGECPSFLCCITGGRYHMAGHGSPQGGADHVSSPWLSSCALQKLSGAGGVRGQLEVGQELRLPHSPTIALSFSLPAE